jgi:hypothetical protein
MQSDNIPYYQELDEDMNNLGDNDQEPHLAKQDYERSLDQESMFKKGESINDIGKSDYQGIADSILVDLQQKYNLRPRDKNITTDPAEENFVKK